MGVHSINLPFNVRNTQFHALYLDRYRFGYEPEVGRFLDALLPDCGVFADIGANWGYFSLWAVSNPRFQGRVVAFEPHPGAFRDLETLTRLANLESRIACYNCALGEEARSAYLVMKDEIHTGEARVSDDGSGMRVNQVRLDDLGEECWPNLMKIDVEGNELSVLLGSGKALEKKRPTIVFESMIDNLERPDDILAPFEFLAHRGYRFFLPAWWCKTEDGESFCFPDNRALFRDEDASLVLVPFVKEQRFCYASKINCVAIDPEKMEGLMRRGIFSQHPLESETVR